MRPCSGYLFGSLVFSFAKLDSMMARHSLTLFPAAMAFASCLWVLLCLLSSVTTVRMAHLISLSAFFCVNCTTNTHSLPQCFLLLLLVCSRLASYSAIAAQTKSLLHSRPGI